MAPGRFPESATTVTCHQHSSNSLPALGLGSEFFYDITLGCIEVKISRYGIGLMLWGDGVVDVKDLIVLAENMFEKTVSLE
jgi:hypothetical protein